MKDYKFAVMYCVNLGENVLESRTRKILIPLGRRRITSMTRDPEKERYLIYLPKELNDLWRELRDKGVTVKFYIEVDEEISL